MDSPLYLSFDDFLSPEVNAGLYHEVIALKEKFISSTTGDNKTKEEDKKNWRRSMVVFDDAIKPYSRILRTKILSIFDDICASLKLTPFENKTIEVQLTAHNDGDFYKPHTDNHSAGNTARVITFVYYFNSEPQRFEGGQLLLMQGKPQVVIPENNKIVFFNSSINHAVHPVNCPGGQFEDGRFTLNGWFRRSPESL